MGWIERLYETYDRQPHSIIGKIEEGVSVPLLPICHTTNKTQIEITIDAKGNFRSAKVIDEATIIPCTEESSARAGSKPTNHPLCDKLQYIAGDFVKYGGVVTSGFAKAPREPFLDYQSLLGAWACSIASHPKVVAVWEYTKKETVIADLIDSRILHLDSTNKLLEIWKSEEPTPLIFKVLSAGSSPSDSFVRWKVESPEWKDDTTWSDESLWESWEAYYRGTREKKGLCFVTGDELPVAILHPAKIRNAGDKAKLISSNDGSGFTYRGRFTEPEQVAAVSLDVTQKAHSALRWLIARQGNRDGDFVVVAWAISDKGVSIPDPLSDTYGLEENIAGLSEGNGDGAVFTGQDLALRLNRLASGYSSKLGGASTFVVMGVDSATPGRMAIKLYRELDGSEYLSRIAHWHEGCAWHQNFGKDRQFIGAPAPRDIAEACYGRRLDERLRRATVERLLPCIVDGAALPRDIVESASRRAANRVGFDNAWEWEKALGIACALYRKHFETRGYSMALEEDRATRDYLFGRLLAVADVLEGRALWKAGESRPTTAARLMQRFSDRPCSTWKTIWLAQAPYKARLGSQADWFNKLVDEIGAEFIADDFAVDKPLGGEFLLGYYCQRAELNRNRKDKDQDQDDETGVDDPEIK
jgi:CRISPR-associated protein Csd1